MGKPLVKVDNRLVEKKEIAKRMAVRESCDGSLCFQEKI